MKTFLHPNELILTTTIIASLIGLAAPASGQTVGSFANVNGPRGAVGNKGGLNIGHTFTVSGTNTVLFNGVLQVIDGFSDLGGPIPNTAFYRLRVE